MCGKHLDNFSGSLQKKVRKNSNYDFFGQQELMIFKNISTLELSTKPLTAGDFLATLIFSTIFQDISVGT
jgi:hypothetical protein